MAPPSEKRSYCDAQVYLFNVNKRQQHFNRIHREQNDYVAKGRFPLIPGVSRKKGYAGRGEAAVDGVAASRSEVDVRPTDRHGVRQRVSGQFHQHSGDYLRRMSYLIGA